TFLRRTYLVLVGRIPMPSEVHAFLEDPDPQKRAKVIDRLLDSPGYANHFTTLWRGWMLPEAATSIEAAALAQPFEAWLRTRLAENVGYDRLVTELLTFPVNPPRTQTNSFFGPLREVFARRELVIPNTDRVVQATFLDDKEPEWRPRTSSRVTLAEWVTAKDNPFFARATVNRVWGEVFGTGIYEPV